MPQSNLFISYDLYNPGQRYDRVGNAIKQCGDWSKLQYSLYFVSTTMTARGVFDHVSKAMDANDTLVVIDTSHNDAIYSTNISTVATQAMLLKWAA